MTVADVAGHLREGLRRAHWCSGDLWLASVALGGRLGSRDVDNITSGVRSPLAAEYELLALALNEHLDEQGDGGSVPFWSEISP